MFLITQTGNGIVILIIVSLALTIFDRKKAIRIPITILLAGVLGGVLVHILKTQVDLSRPLAMFPEAHFLGKPLMRGSFPSGHTQLCFSTAAVLAKEYRKSWKFLYLWALLVGYSRIYVGAHFPLDVLAGGAIGYLSGKFVLWYNYLLRKESQTPLMKEEKECGKE
jgi:undecaprenyl-diphosphatase